MEPGCVYTFEVKMMVAAQLFPAGHCMRVEVTSSAFPRYSRNLNTGGPIANEIRMEIAENRIYLDAAHPSHIVLPVYAWAGG
jgi:uncharacterized protein